MLPQKETAILQNGFYITQQPSKTYHMDFKKEVSMGKTDGLEALRQAVFLILHIQRYEHLIYSWRYGVELKDLFGKQITSLVSIFDDYEYCDLAVSKGNAGKRRVSKIGTVFMQSMKKSPL